MFNFAPTILLLTHQAFISRLQWQQTKQKCKDDTCGLLGTAGILAGLGIRHSLFVKTEMFYFPQISLWQVGVTERGSSVIIKVALSPVCSSFSKSLQGPECTAGVMRQK